MGRNEALIEEAKHHKKRQAREAQVRDLVRSLETFIDENIRCALRQHAPEYAPRDWCINDLHNARERLVKAFVDYLP